MISVKGQNLNIDVQEELEPYLDRFDQYKIRDDKLQARSPFREDSHPSFAVNLENGSWIDSGAVGNYHKGHFIQLLAFLREEEVEETAEYLLDIYSFERLDTSSLKLDMSGLVVQEELPFIPEEQLQQYAYRSPYLGHRGISEAVQKLFRVGYDRKNKAVVMPHTDSHGNVINIKFRSVQKKQFWYSGGQKVKNYLYGLYQCRQVMLPILYVVESEIDCMRLWTEGIPAVALGTAHMSRRQQVALLTSPAETLVIATDNDSAGEQCAKQIATALSGYMNVGRLVFPDGAIKDICDMSAEQLRNHKINYKLFN